MRRADHGDGKPLTQGFRSRVGIPVMAVNERRLRDLFIEKLSALLNQVVVDGQHALNARKVRRAGAGGGAGLNQYLADGRTRAPGLLAGRRRKHRYVPARLNQSAGKLEDMRASACLGRVFDGYDEHFGLDAFCIEVFHKLALLGESEPDESPALNSTGSAYH